MTEVLGRKFQSKMKKNISLKFEQSNGEGIILEEWNLYQDTRHGKDGYRTTRYVKASTLANDLQQDLLLVKNEMVRKRMAEMAYEYLADPDVMIWDESHMFFTTIESAFQAFSNNELTEGRKAF